jgi:methylated-DNA-protein-cysteine methyltransferase related protein
MADQGKQIVQPPIYQRIYAIVRQIPTGKVATYGQISHIVPGCNARMVGYAMAALRDVNEGEPVPWQRVINSQGKISLTGEGAAIQRQLLEEEGVQFDAQGIVDFNEFGWLGMD